MVAIRGVSDGSRLAIYQILPSFKSAHLRVARVFVHPIPFCIWVPCVSVHPILCGGVFVFIFFCLIPFYFGVFSRVLLVVCSLVVAF